MYLLAQVSVLSWCLSVAALDLTVLSSGGNKSSANLFGLLYEDIYHSGDGGIYGELIQNRAFQGTSNGNGEYASASLTPTTQYWYPIGTGVNLSIDTTTPHLSTQLPSQMKMQVPAKTSATVGFYNAGYWGFDVDSSSRYIASFYVRGTYTGTVNVSFVSTTSGEQLSSATISLNQTLAEGWIQTYSNTFKPSQSAQNANNTVQFTFSGAQLAGKSIDFNLLSVFKQTFDNRNNGLRADLAEVLDSMDAAYLRMPGGNNLEGTGPPYFLMWNETVGPLINRPGYPGTWGSTQTNGLGLLEIMQWCTDMNLTPILGIWAGLYLDGTVVAEASLEPYVQLALDELEFLLGDESTQYGALRASYGYPDPFTVDFVEIGNEDFLNGGQDSYTSYRFNAFYSALSAKYPDITYISTVNFFPDITGVAIDLHVYGNEAYFVSLFDAFDLKNRSFPLLIGEYAATNTGSNSDGQVGAQTFGMALAEAIFLLGCERNSDVVFGTSYGALMKNYNEAPDTVAVVKQTANEVLLTMSYYVQQLFASYHGSTTAAVTASGGGFGPFYWSATRSSTQTFLKIVNYDGAAGTVSVTVQGSTSGSATLITMTAPNSTSVNNLPGLGGEASVIQSTTITQQSAGTFNVAFTEGYELAILIVDT